MNGLTQELVTIVERLLHPELPVECRNPHCRQPTNNANGVCDDCIG